VPPRHFSLLAKWWSARFTAKNWAKSETPSSCRQKRFFLPLWRCAGAKEGPEFSPPSRPPLPGEQKANKARRKTAFEKIAPPQGPCGETQQNKHQQKREGVLPFAFAVKWSATYTLCPKPSAPQPKPCCRANPKRQTHNKTHWRPKEQPFGIQ